MKYWGVPDLYHSPLATSETSSVFQGTPRISPELLEDGRPVSHAARLQAALATTASCLAALVAYPWFVLAILVQSLRNRKAVRPTRWQASLDRSTVAMTLPLFLALAALPLAPLHPGLRSRLPSDLDAGFLVALCCVPVLVIHLLTVAYIFSLPHYNHPFAKSVPQWTSLSSIVSITHPIVESAQLYAIGVVLSTWATTHPLGPLARRISGLGPAAEGQLAAVAFCVAVFGLLLGYMVARPGPPTSPLATLALQVLPGTLLPTLLNGLLAAAAASPAPAALTALEAAVAFAVAAPFVVAYKAPDGMQVESLYRVRTSPRFLVLERVGKCVMCVLIFFIRLYHPDALSLQRHLLMGLVATLCIVVAWMRPAYLDGLNWVRCYLLASVLGLYALEFGFVRTDDRNSFVYYGAAWGAATAMYLGAYRLATARQRAADALPPRCSYALQEHVSDL